MAKQAKQLVIQSRCVYNAEIKICPHCGALLQPQTYYQWRKTVQQLTGAVHIAHRASECVNPECSQAGQMYPSARAQSITLPGCTYGRDVIAQIGWWRERQYWDRQQIHQTLQAQVQVSEREIDYLYTRYEVLRGTCSVTPRRKWYTSCNSRSMWEQQLAKSMSLILYHSRPVGRDLSSRPMRHILRG